MSTKLFVTLGLHTFFCGSLLCFIFLPLLVTFGVGSYYSSSYLIGEPCSSTYTYETQVMQIDNETSNVISVRLGLLKIGKEVIWEIENISQENLDTILKYNASKDILILYRSCDSDDNSLEEENNVGTETFYFSRQIRIKDYNLHIFLLSLYIIASCCTLSIVIILSFAILGQCGVCNVLLCHKCFKISSCVEIISDVKWIFTPYDVNWDSEENIQGDLEMYDVYFTSSED
jgi:hypothetical protein